MRLIPPQVYWQRALQLSIRKLMRQFDQVLRWQQLALRLL
jgi:hypothetical protein